MTDEKYEKLILQRQKLILQRLSQLGTIGYHDPDVACRWILDGYAEIERLAEENKELKKSLHHLHSARETDMGTAE